MLPRGASVRAAIITFFVFFNALAALPTPGEPSPERLQRPFERNELRRWTRLFVALGIDTDAERLGRGYLGFSSWVMRARELALAPIEGWMALTQTHQGWRLFGTPDRQVSALRVTARSALGDEVLYESGNPMRRWNAAFLEYRRIRAEYNPSRRGPPPTYAAFAERLSQTIFASMPQVDRVTVALVDTRVDLPASASADAASGDAASSDAASSDAASSDAASSDAASADAASADAQAERVEHVIELTRPGT